MLIHPSIHTSIRLRDAIGLLYLTEKITYLTYAPLLNHEREGLPSCTIERAKKRFRYGTFAMEKKGQEHGANLGLPIESKSLSKAKSFEQRRLHRCGLLCALHAGACFRLGATTTTIWRFSSPFDPQTIYLFFPPPLPLSILKKKTLPLLSPSPLWVATPFVSAFHFASLSFPPRKSSSLAPSFDGARWCF